MINNDAPSATGNKGEMNFCIMVFLLDLAMWPALSILSYRLRIVFQCFDKKFPVIIRHYPVSSEKTLLEYNRNQLSCDFSALRSTVLRQNPVSGLVLNSVIGMLNLHLIVPGYLLWLYDRHKQGKIT